MRWYRGLLLVAMLGTVGPIQAEPDAATALKALQSKAIPAKRHSISLIDPTMADPPNSRLSSDFINARLDHCRLDEVEYQEIDRTIIRTWRTAALKKDADALVALLDAEARLHAFAVLTAPETIAQGTDIFAWKSGRTDEYFTRTASATAEMQRYLGAFARIDDLSMTTTKLWAGKRQRDKMLGLREATLLVQYDLRGIEVSGARRNDQAELTIRVVGGPGHWKIASIGVLKGQTLRSKDVWFADVTTQKGLNNIPTLLRTEAIRRGGYALSVTDINADQRPDIFVGTVKKSVALLGKGDGTFAPLANSPILGDTLVKTAIFADFFNTGRQDLLAVRFSMTDSTFNQLQFYRSLGNGQFEAGKSPVAMTSDLGHAMPATVADWNADGFLDFYVGYPGSKDFTFEPFEGVTQKAWEPQGIYFNDRNKAFVDGSKQSLASNTLIYENLYPHASMATDFDDDGDVDIAVIDDRGNVSPFLRNLGQGIFENAANQMGVRNGSYGMSIARGDLDGDGRSDLVLTAVNFAAGERLNESCVANFDQTYFSDFSVRGLRAYKNMGDGRYAEVTDVLGLPWLGEGLAGVEFLDANGDGWQDLYVVNGLWSGTTPEQDISSLFMVAHEITERALSPDFRQNGQPDIMNILSGFKGDLFGGKAMERPSMAGYQRNRLLLNGRGKFYDVGYVAGVDSIADGYVVAVADMNNDRRPDLVLRNADPGIAEYSYPPVQVYENRFAGYQGLTVQLEGSISNRDAIGAKVNVQAGGRTQMRELLANNGAAQSLRELYFGLAGAQKADLVSVTWPSGKTQEFKHIAAGKIRIKEEAERPVVLSQR